MKPVFAFLVCAIATNASAVPVEQFFGKPSVTGASLSPDGRNVVLRRLSPAGRSMLNVVDVETHAQKVVASFGNADINMFYWQSDKQLVYSVINVDHGGSMGDPGLYAVDRDGTGFTPLAPTVVRQRSFADSDYADRSYLAASTINGFPYRKSEAMFAIERTDDTEALVRVNTRGRGRASVNAPAGTYRWLSDPNGDIRITVARRAGKEIVFYKVDGGWRQLASFDPSSAEGFQPLLYVDGRLYVRAHNGNNESSIYRYDLVKNAIEETPLITVPGFDADGYFIVDDRKVLGFRVNTDSENTVWFDATMKAMQLEIDTLMPGTVNTLSYGSHSETPYVLIDAHSDTMDHDYLLYNRDNKKLLRLGSSHPDIDPKQMAPMTMQRYPARDGLQVPVYITKPAGAGKQLPTVVLVSDPQWKRSDSWEWDAEVQFLASRGYVVLQPQPRGTPGFGRGHEAAGAKQWGLAIQDDIADAVKWSVAQGYTDPARVCIAGAGYGGYAAMMGLIRDPALFKCGVSWSGITDIGAMFSHNWNDLAEPKAMAQLRDIVGDPKLDAAQFKATSPLHNAARIKQPVLLAYGKDDSRVPFSDGRKFYEALSATNSNVEWREYTPSVEDWKTQGNRIDLWRRIEAFLAKNIGATTPGS
ncbi:prolyl oligopeptidase family serine peptidase [Duganella sp. FT135W]|uniref:Prolyl oligopeptidase family serine peptidase n=1 Tax=Duganella flavida TaxID=2692175 RepID=A0A6L8K556_9BURK|nr:prolyl oligopeptidase family serine peptidase [Duganella flavida]MYM21062.1 prolyl oligopeptidase family serine peptidase [Duganella flavida]